MLGLIRGNAEQMFEIRIFPQSSAEKEKEPHKYQTHLQTTVVYTSTEHKHSRHRQDIHFHRNESNFNWPLVLAARLLFQMPPPLFSGEEYICG